MKKICTVAFLAIISLLVFCSCGDKALTEQDTSEITYTDIYLANTYSELTSNHSSVYLKDKEWTEGEYSDVEYYWSKSGYAFTSFPNTESDGSSVQGLSFVTDEGSYLYFEPVTAEKPTYDMMNYYVGSGAPTIKSMCAFGLVSPKYNQTVTEYKKTDNGCEVSGENSDMSFVKKLCSSYFPDEEYSDGDKVLFKFELNEKLEVLKYENYYVYKDGREPIMFSCGEFVYDGSDCPDYINKVNAIMEKGAKDISVIINTENGSVERKVYSDAFQLYTDYEVYSDAEYTDLLTTDKDYYMFDTDKDIRVYLKTPTFELMKAE